MTRNKIESFWDDVNTFTCLSDLTPEEKSAFDFNMKLFYNMQLYIDQKNLFDSQDPNMIFVPLLGSYINKDILVEKIE